MAVTASQEIELLTEIRDLLLVMAEPALSQRDAKLRSSLRSVVGRSSPRAKAVLLMDGTRPPAAIAKGSGLDKGNLSRLLKALAAARLISAHDKSPRLVFRITPSFFEGEDADEQ